MKPSPLRDGAWRTKRLTAFGLAHDTSFVCSCYDSRCLSDLAKAGIDQPVANRNSSHSNHVRSCLASLENALKTRGDAMIASALVFVPDCDERQSGDVVRID